MSKLNPIAIGLETLMIDSIFSVEKKFTELIRMNPYIILYVIVNQVHVTIVYVVL